MRQAARQSPRRVDSQALENPMCCAGVWIFVLESGERPVEDSQYGL